MKVGGWRFDTPLNPFVVAEGERAGPVGLGGGLVAKVEEDSDAPELITAAFGILRIVKEDEVTTASWRLNPVRWASANPKLQERCSHVELDFNPDWSNALPSNLC